jgi:hypothetical protein
MSHVGTAIEACPVVNNAIAVAPIGRSRDPEPDPAIAVAIVTPIDMGCGLLAGHPDPCLRFRLVEQA